MASTQLIRVIGAVVAISAVASACSGGRGDPAPPSPVTSSPAKNATTAPLLPTETSSLPDATPQTYAELLTQLKGTPVVVNVWGSWCGPCLREAPHLADAAEKHGDTVQFVGIDILDTKESARGFIEDVGWTYPSLYDPSPSGTIRSSLGYLGQPVTIFYDADGQEMSHWEGALSPEILEEGIQGILARDGSLPPGQTP